MTAYSASSRATRPTARMRPRLAAAPTASQIPASRVATSQHTKHLWDAVKNLFGVDAPNYLTVGQVQGINRLADDVEKQKLMQAQYLQQARAVAGSIAEMEEDRVKFVKEAKPLVGKMDKALYAATVETAKHGAARRLTFEKTRAELNQVRVESDGDVREVHAQAESNINLAGMDLEARLRLIVHQGQITATNLGRQYALKGQELSSSNQERIQASEQARIAGQYKRAARTGLMKALLGR